MNQTQQQEFARQCEAYRERHGAQTLMPYVGRGARWMCKLHDPQRVVLVKLGSYDELTVSAEEFAAEFQWYILDEAVYYFGSKEAQDATDEDLKQQNAAIQRCFAAEDNSGQPLLIGQ